jgi:hypothetical protein
MPPPSHPGAGPARDLPAQPGRRRFLTRGIAGAALLAGAGWVAWWRSEAAAPWTGAPLLSLDAASAAVVLAAARRLLPSGPPFPSPEEARVVERVDAYLAQSHPGVQREARQLLALLDSPALGLLLDGAGFRFRAADGEAQEARLAAWATSRVDVRRTGFRALRRLVTSSYWSNPVTWGAAGYPGPPAVGGG